MKIQVGFADIMNTIFIHKVSFNVVEPGYRLDSRYHKIFEILYCYDGKMLQWLNEKEMSFGTGDWLFISSGVRHRTFNATKSPVSFLAIHFDIDDPGIRKLLKSLHMSQSFIPRRIAEQSLLPRHIQSIESHMQSSLISGKYTDTLEEQVHMAPLQSLAFQTTILLIIQEMIRLQQELALSMPVIHPRTVSSIELDIANQIAALLEQSPNEPFLIQTIARMVNLSRSQCTKIFTKVYGIPPRKYLSSFIIKKSRELLLQTNLSIEEISHQLGFSSTQHFSKQFRRWTGFPPGKFRPKHDLQ